MQNYDREILKVLTEVGQRGLSISKIALHVHNACNTLFSNVSYEEVHRYVAQYLLRNSKNPDSIIERTERGIYHLNIRSQETRQLMLQFVEEADEVEKHPLQYVDESLSLFDEK